MEAARTSETSVDNHFTRQYNPEDSSEHHTRRRENLKSHNNQLPSTLDQPSLEQCDNKVYFYVNFSCQHKMSLL
jgi:hypothetical protein